MSAPRPVQYTAKEKRRTILFAEVHGNRAASREYNVPEIHQDAIFLCCFTRKRFREKPPAYPELEEITDQRSKKLPVTRRILALNENDSSGEWYRKF